MGQQRWRLEIPAFAGMTTWIGNSRFHMSANPPKTARLEGRIALITGASRGIGAAVARRFAREGAHVVLTARTVGALEEIDDAIRAEGGAATLVPLDLLKHDHIDPMAASLYERFGRLDILVGNAGMLGTLSPIAHADPLKWRQVLDLNLMANLWLIRAVDPLLRASEAGRAIFVTADQARDPQPYWGAYAVANSALETLVRLYAAETAKSAIRANLIDPGVVRTRLRADAFPGEDAARHPPPEAITESFVHMAMADFEETGTVVQAVVNAE